MHTITKKAFLYIQVDFQTCSLHNLKKETEVNLLNIRQIPLYILSFMRYRN